MELQLCAHGGKLCGKLLLLCCWLWMPGVLGVDTTLTVVSADGAPFPNLTDIVVGGASDVIVTVRCVATPAGPVEWSYGGNSSVVTSGLTPFGVSQEDGVLRIYPASLLEDEDQYTCSSGQTHTVSVRFRLAPSLFFTSTVLPTINMPSTDVTTVCPVPDIPQATVTVGHSLGMDNITYCNVTSERGLFRSRSVTIVDPTQQVPTYWIEPVNITARPTSGSSARAAFSCSITPDENLTTIQWFFEPMEFGSRMGPSMMVESGFLTSGVIGVANVTIVGGLADPGTSILVLDRVGNDREGLYSCVATFSDGRMINSSSGALIYNATANSDDTITLSPPTTLSVQEGEAVTVPCVVSGTQQPVFMFGGSVLPTGAQSNQYSLDFATIAPESNGSYSCQVGSTTSTFRINVLEPLEFTADSILRLQPEYRVCPGTATTNRIVLRCYMPEGNPPPGPNIWLRNGAEVGVVGPGNRMELTADRRRLIIIMVEEGDAGIYQCLSSVDNQPATTIAQSGYLNVYSLRDINVASPTQEIILSLPDTPPTITLNCSVVAHPIPRLEWTMNGQPVVGQQAATGFMETSFSLLTVNTSDLVNGVETFSCTATLDLNGMDSTGCSTFDGSISASVNITTYSMVNITEDPRATGPVLVGERAVFTCRARSIPPPTITWFQFQNGMEVVLVDNGDDITITSQSQPEDNFTTLSVLSVRVTGDEDFTRYFCVGDNGFDNSTSDVAQLGSMVNITEDPQATGPVLVEETAVFTCRARSIPFPTITWFRFQNGMAVGLVDNGDDIIITSQSQPEDSLTTLSVLSVRVTGDEDFTRYFCVGDNGFDNSTSDNTTLVQAVSPSFIEQPSNVTGAIGDFISLNCTATGAPLPTIIWEDGDGGNIIDDVVYNITTVVAENVISVLEFGVLNGVNRSQFHCVAENRAGQTESELATIIIGGVPLPPNPMVDSITSQAALVLWLPPFSILPLIQYNITWVQVDTGEDNSTTVDAGMTQLLLTNLRPNWMYRVTVVAVNRVGPSLPSDPVVFTTAEDVPDAPPTIITSSSTRRNEIDVSWEPPPLELQNGLITHYNVCYVAEGEAQTEQCVNVSSSFTSTTLTMGIFPGTTYLIRVAAATAVGLGPFSGNLRQMTLSDPPTSIPEFPTVATTTTVTASTIPITLPTFPNSQDFSHFWVIALITDASIDTSQQPTELFMDNSSFTNYSSSVSPGRPYIVAEISSMNYPTTFILGANNSMNDFPELYMNGPLQPNTEYTAFVWAFVPSVPNGLPVSKRQASSLPRQFSSFSSSGFLPPVRTAALFQLQLGGLSNCQEWTGIARNAKLSDITNAVVQNINQLCQCELSAECITESVFQCFANSEQQVTFRARMCGTTSSKLLDYLEMFVSQTDSTIAVQGVSLDVDSSCPVAITTFNDSECPPPTTPPSTTPPSTTPPSDNTAAIIGGVVAVVVATTVIVIVIAVLVANYHRAKLSIHRDVRKEPANWSHVARSGDEEITTTRCEAYELTNLDHEYEEIAGYQNPEFEYDIVPNHPEYEIPIPQSPPNTPHK